MDSFEFVTRYQKFFSQKLDIEEGARDYAKNLDTKQAVPPMIKLVTLSHNFQRFFLTKTESKTVTRGQIDSLIALINDLGNIFFKLPKLFFPFPPFEVGHTGESKTEEQMKMILTRDKIKRKRYGAIFRFTILAFIDGMIYCSNEL